MKAEICGLCDDCPMEVKEKTFPEMHEIHVTVETNDPLFFKIVCEENSIKPLLIEFQSSKSSTAQHVMTGQRVKGSKQDAIVELDRVVGCLEREGMIVTRKKIESNKTGIGSLYHEVHFAFSILSRTKGILQYITKSMDFDLRLSKNAFKKTGISSTWMVTYRNYGDTREKVEDIVNQISGKYKELGFEPSKIILECCWFDSNVQLDEEWI